MTRLQLLLTKLAEEGSEIAQIALKTQQFGLDSKGPGQPLTNAEQVHSEIDDLMAAVEMLNEEFGLGYVPSRERIEAKKAKVNHFAAYSEQLGFISK
jgi:NTP pyrophosphatase (non-canonical NTP hydrolase)